MKFKALILALLIPLSVSATDYMFTGADGGNWTNSVNWTPAAVPGADDRALLGAVNANITMTANASISGLVMYSSSGGFTINGAGFVLTLGSNGISRIDSNNRDFVFNVGIAIGADQTWDLIGSGLSSFNFNGAMSGSRRVVRTGTATMFRNVASPAFAGGFTYNEGSLVAGVANIFGDSYMVIKSAATVYISLNASFDQSIGGIEDAGVMQMDTANADEQVCHLYLEPQVGVVARFSGELTPCGNTNGGLLYVIKNGLGTQILSGDNGVKNNWQSMTINAGIIMAANSNAFSQGGTITVNTGGNLAVTNGTSLRSVTVAGGTLSGNGTFGGSETITAGSFITPGLSVGTLTFASNLTINAFSTLEYELATTNASDFIQVNGQLDLGGNIRITPLTGFGVGVYPLFGYGTITTNNTPRIITPIGYNGTLSTDDVAKKVYLTIASDTLRPIASGSSLVTTGGKLLLSK